EAAKRDVGTGQNQIPDMSYWTKSGSINLNSGWRRTPDGFIEQWGSSSASTSSSPGAITFPIAFPNAALSIQLTEKTGTGLGGNVCSWGLADNTLTKTGASVICTSPTTETCFFRAIGY
ncbi:gp53-like domain-containing protein, partial [Citrobacter koseri]